MLQATASLIAEARAEEQGRLLSSYLGDKTEPVGDGTPKQEYNRRSGYTLTARLRTRVCSDSCLKVVYLSCATLISASFIVECILLHLIIVPYLSESVFEAGACRYISSRSEMKKRCENKCSKERSYFPCLQISVLFTPFRQMITVPGGSFLNTTTIMGSGSASNNLRNRFLSDGSLSSPNEVFWDSSRWRDLTKETTHNLNTSGSRMVYLYDYFSTFAAHKTARCATSPCHRREEDNVVAVEEFKRELWARKEFLCYARPSKQTNPTASPSEISDSSFQSASNVAIKDVSNFSMSDDEETSSEIDDINLQDDERTEVTSKPTGLDPKEIMQREIWERQSHPLNSLLSPPSRDPQDAAAILHRLYSSAMFWHSLCWPGVLFFGSLLLLLFTYLADGCEAWASDKTVIA